MNRLSKYKLDSNYVPDSEPYLNICRTTFFSLTPGAKYSSYASVLGLFALQNYGFWFGYSLLGFDNNQLIRAFGRDHGL